MKDKVDLVQFISQFVDCEITDLAHAYRINGVLDVWKNGVTVYNIVENKYSNILDDVEKKIFCDAALTNEKREPFKKVKNGMSYQEFKNIRRNEKW